jgi:alkanesulfonate monooxygenase SsuD/methylene tetrahydromethanopterin reductase-like flavin-dependent oxidoreductase (luciferase family)
MLFSTGKAPIEYVPDLIRFNERRASHGWDPVQPTLFQNCYCAETEEKAWENARKYMGRFIMMSNWHYGLHNAARFDEAGAYEWWAEQAKQLASVDDDTIATAFADAQIWGTPGQCIDKIRDMQRTMNPDQLNLVMRIGGMSFEDSKESIELFAREVLPEVRSAPPEEEERRAAATERRSDKDIYLTAHELNVD